jgi:Copper type II ascorbate-dependent monooxygenase, C-terminal domain
MSAWRSLPHVLTALALIGCSSASGDDPSSTGGGGAGGAPTTGAGGSNVTVGGGTGGNASTHSLTIGPFDVAPGQEQTMCVVVPLENAEAAMLRGLRTHLTTGSHHLIVTKIVDGVASPEPTPCGAFAHGGDALFIAEKPEMTLTYPDGTGLPMDADQLIGIEMHFINYQSANLEISGTVDFDLVPDDGAMGEVHLLFEGNTSIALPPQSQQTLESEHSVPAGAQVFAITSHTHQLGVYASVHKTGSGSDELIHESDSWAEPPFDVFDPALTFGAGERLRLRCDFDNPSDQTVTFGTSFYDEMCFLWAHYVMP